MIQLITEGVPPFNLSDPLTLIFFFFTFAFGASFGSFTNVLIHRLPLDMSVAYPPSACPQCQRPIRWYENIPILSYLFLRGRCAGCGVSISSQYPIIELALGVWSTALATRYLWPLFGRPERWAADPSILTVDALTWLWFTAFACALVAITLIDLRYTFVPDEISINGVWLALIGGFFLSRPQPLDHFWGALVGYSVIVVIRVVGFWVYRREAMGLGDAKLLAMIGGFLGWKALPLILFGAASQGLIAAVLALTYTRVTGRANLLTLTSDELDERFGEEDLYEDQQVMLVMPFGPFLCLAAFEVLTFGEATLWTLPAQALSALTGAA